MCREPLPTSDLFTTGSFLLGLTCDGESDGDTDGAFDRAAFVRGGDTTLSMTDSSPNLLGGKGGYAVPFDLPVTCDFLEIGDLGSDSPFGGLAAREVPFFDLIGDCERVSADPKVTLDGYLPPVVLWRGETDSRR